MGIRIYGWRSADGEEFATKAEMEAYEGLEALADWFQGHLTEGSSARDLAKSAQADGKTLLALLRKAGVKATRKPEAKPRKRRTKAELADAAD